MPYRVPAEHTEMEIPDRRAVTIPAADWEKFKEWVNVPAQTISVLRRRAATRPMWED